MFRLPVFTPPPLEGMWYGNKCCVFCICRDSRSSPFSPHFFPYLHMNFLFFMSLLLHMSVSKVCKRLFPLQLSRRQRQWTSKTGSHFSSSYMGNFGPHSTRKDSLKSGFQEKAKWWQIWPQRSSWFENHTMPNHASKLCHLELPIQSFSDATGVHSASHCPF